MIKLALNLEQNIQIRHYARIRFRRESKNYKDILGQVCTTSPQCKRAYFHRSGEAQVLVMDKTICRSDSNMPSKLRFAKMVVLTSLNAKMVILAWKAEKEEDTCIMLDQCQSLSFLVFLLQNICNINYISINRRGKTHCKDPDFAVINSR